MNVDNSSDDLLNVRETAKLLGVHENTVRNWVKDGALPDARVPGSKFHRFRRIDIERMRSRRADASAESGKERQMIGPELVDATQLNIWAGTKAAQSLFPELIRRLLASTPGVQRILIRAGEGVAISGYDGSALSSVPQKYLPAGDLRFEFGVNQKVKAKADEDWSKRTATSTSTDTVFVFATPRRWGGAQPWADDRRAEGKFADVWVIDADVLEGWLADAPAVHVWISEQLGRRPHDAQTLENWWNRLSSSTKPQLPAALFLAGRNEQAKRLQKFIAGPAGLLTLRTEWEEDGKAFVYATVCAAENDHPQAQVILIETPEVWSRIVAQSSPAILIPTFDNADIAAATANGHHVVLILDQSAASTEHPDMTLSRFERIAAVETLQNSDVKFETAQGYVVHARRNLQAFVRSISINPKYARPAWTQPPLARPLATLMLVGQWTTSESDIKLVEKLVDKPWSEIEPLLEQVSVPSTDDPVFRKVGNLWSLTSPSEAFDLLASALKAADIVRWDEALRMCLTETDPTLDLNSEERPLAGIRGIHRKYSSAVRKGMAQSATLMGARGQSFALDDGRSLASHATSLLGTVFAEVAADSSGRKWEELVDVLPLLAEAAPQEFLDTLNKDISSPKPGLATLFQDGTRSSFFSLGPDSPHPWLLWAIETVTWSADYFMDGIRMLAKLAALDPGGNTSNRPIASLSSVLCGWLQNTSVDVAQKIEALDAVRDIDTEISWELLLKLWPSDHGFNIPPASPRFQDWQPGSTSVSMADWVTFTHAVVDRSIQLAERDPKRITQLVEDLGNVPKTDQAKILKLLELSTAQSSKLDAEQRFQLWEGIHEIVARHESFSSAAWSFDPEILAKLRSVLTDLEPANNPKRYAYLFDWHPDLPEVNRSDYAAHGELLNKLQTEAINELMKTPNPLESLEAVTRQAPVPDHVGWAMAENEQVDLSNVLPWLGSSEPAIRAAGSSWFSHRIQLHGATWLEQSLADKGLADDARNIAIRSVPSERQYWDVLAKRTADADLYWQNAHIRAFHLSPADAVFAVEQLVAHGRAWAAIEVLADVVHPANGENKPKPGIIQNELVIDTLNRAIDEDPQSHDISNMTNYYVKLVLDYLVETQADEPTMARFEFAFFRLLEHTREPQVLNTVLAKDPGTFVDLAKRVYRGKNDPKIDPSEREQQLAQQAWWVLHGWKGYPGRREDGKVDVSLLNSWVKDARLQFSETGRADVGDELIGEAFAHSPVGKDGAWPAEPIRDLIETIGSQQLENGFIIGRRNARGVTMRGPYDGGAQERVLVEQYRSWAKIVASKWPRTARLLRRVADAYDEDARREDIRAEIEGDRD